ncbi:citrate lyase acyl carrier protein [Fusibacter bizertensis]|uniref:Citrate lyase acyl carrier protein n=1 Tax=Fusibacter bizertensis TaxID=1488331 RepID=A0ABT6NCW5_9FIRM|nr:citrate lyase acyl carrier protein [Fusibacter bizertensis]MDH8678267.1 citrate lyase acyl carrier protein [Fusibacter bizertensis]
MKIIKPSIAGTLDSCDIQIRIEESVDQTNTIYLKSPVEKQFGEHIRSLIQNMLDKYALEGVLVHAVDKGALDCTIKARTESAIMRAMANENSVDWSVIAHG